MRAMDAQNRKADIDAFKERLVKKALTENSQVDVVQLRQQLDQRPASHFLNFLDQDKDRMVEAELQKRLTKAVPFFRGKLTQNLGLRYAPEIRFYRDNTLDIYEQFRNQANQYLEETQKQDAEDSLKGAPKEMIELMQRLQTLKKMDIYERKMAIGRSQSAKEREMLQNLFDRPGELQRVEENLMKAIKEKQNQHQQAKQDSLDKLNNKPTRRDLRAQREYEKLKKKISEASQTNFDELSEKPLSPSEMEQSLIGVASDVRPTKEGLDSPVSKKFTVDEKTGEKTRL